MTPRAMMEIAPERGQHLAAALLTTFEPADRSILVDRLLPALLGLSPAPAKEAQEFARSRAELCSALGNLGSGKLVIISSARDDVALQWLSPYIRFMRTQSVQHAKLWMLLWRNDKGHEWLEIQVSSANLTGGGIDGQIQAAWRHKIKLGNDQAAHAASWDDLPAFLEQLAVSTADKEQCLSRFSALLRRAACPAGVRFIASTPKRNGTLTLAAALKPFKPTRMRILAPFTGAWNRSSLEAWLEESGCNGVTQLQLMALSKGSTEPEADKWVLPEATLKQLWAERESGTCKFRFGLLNERWSKLLRGGASADDDRRWTHAKLYEFSKANKTSALLLTSANLTQTAWMRHGDNNFELGVLLSGAALPDEYTIASKSEQLQARGEAQSDGAGLWADAEWDGKKVTVRIKATQSPKLVQLQPVVPREALKKGKSIDGLLCFTIARTFPPPRVVEIKVGKSGITIPVADLRTDPDDLPIDEWDQATREEWREQLLLEKYGAVVTDPDPDAERSRRGTKKSAAANGDYSVATLEKAREYFDRIDSWQQALDRRKDPVQTPKDGDALLALFRRRAADNTAEARVAQAVADELSIRLKKAKDDQV